MKHLFNEYTLQVASLILDIFLLKIDKEKKIELTGAIGENSAFIKKISSSFVSIKDAIQVGMRERVSDELHKMFSE